MAKQPINVTEDGVNIRPSLTSTEKKNFKNEINKINQEYKSGKMPGVIKDRVNKLERLLRNDVSNKNLNKTITINTKKENLGGSPSEIREDKKRNKQKRGEKVLNLSPSGKIKGERQSDLQRLEEIKKNQAAEDAAKKKKAKGKGPKLGGEFTGPRKNVLKRMNMGGVMKNRGGMFKGTY